MLIHYANSEILATEPTKEQPCQANNAAAMEARKLQEPSRLPPPRDGGMMDGTDIHLTWEMTGRGGWQGRWPWPQPFPQSPPPWIFVRAAEKRGAGGGRGKEEGIRVEECWTSLLEHLSLNPAVS